MKTEYTTEDYQVEIAQSREDEVPVYHIVNKITGVMEYEDHLLPRTIDSMLQMQERMNEVRERMFPTPPDVLNLVN